MIGHLGSRVSDLLDGRLSAEEEERAWDHVHLCHQCRDQVEREGWVKTRLAGLSLSSCGGASPALKGSLLDASLLLPPGESYLVAGRSRARSSVLAAAGPCRQPFQEHQEQVCRDAGCSSLFIVRWVQFHDVEAPEHR